MRLLYLPLIYNGANNEQKYLEREFRKHYEVKVLDYLNVPDPNKELKEIIDEWKPVIMHSQFQGTNVIDPEIVKYARSKNCITTQWTGDVRSEPIPEYIAYGKHCDINFVTALDDIVAYEREGLERVIFWPNAVADPEQIGSPPTNPSKIMFCGGNYGSFNQSQQRRDLIAAFRHEFGDMFVLYGSGWDTNSTLPWDEQTDRYARSYLILGHNNVGGKEWWFSDRTLIAMGSGRPYLSQYSVGFEDLFDEGEDCLFWRSISEAISKAKWLLENGEQATEIGRFGQRTVRKYHTWQKRVVEYNKHINEYLECS